MRFVMMWKMVNTPRKKRMFVRWWGDVQESLKRSSYNTKCTIFYHSSIYIAIQNVQNVEYSTIPKYTKYTLQYKIYKIYNIFYHSFLYTLPYLHVSWFLQPCCTKSSLSALMRGSNLCNSLHCTCWEPWQTKSSLSALMRGSDNALVGPTQIMTRW